jgi:hypothetical protein
MIIGLNLNAQTNLPINFKTTEQSTTKPDDDDGELYFTRYYIAQPINVIFTGYVLNMFTDKGKIILKKNVKSYSKIVQNEDGVVEKWILNVSSNDSLTRYDTIQIIIDHRYKWKQYQVILPTKDIYGENYTSYRKFTDEELALK